MPVLPEPSPPDVRHTDAETPDAAGRWRALAAPVVLAAYTVAGALGAILALAPAVLARGPVGRRLASRGVPPSEEEREALGG